MNKKYFLGLLLLLLSGIGPVFSRTISSGNDSAAIDALNRFIDHSVVRKDQAALDSLYADDFKFTHGTGMIDNKSSWIRGVMDPKTKYISREHDSTIVEVHDHLAMIYGKLTIVRQAENAPVKYAIKYVRVFIFKDKHWQMISHRTVQQWNNLPLP